MEKKKIGVIGVGNMGGAIVAGIVKSGYTKPANLFVSDRNPDVLKDIKKSGVQVSADNQYIVRNADMIIVAVKPWHIESVLKEIQPLLSSDKVILSIVAGVCLDDLARMAGRDIPIFRVMPNTAIALQESLTCISSNEELNIQRDDVVELFNHLGRTIEIPEDLMAAATALSSCGIAYALRYIRAAMEGGIEIGFGAKMAQLVVAQTVRGAAELILHAGNHPEQEIDKVTTPRGITITGLNEMEHNGFSSSVIQGILASYNKL
ncbi:MAG: pyrroline-5-carboxylate reductase [Mariniphaga sp.]|nr:pyrroline-5-carboxylate reductase [Mariniphaga sp.]MDD4226833.1 pyrroline-5-carboxylate reductase [Mariniphaga sp.]MDD4424534.1 pyrroline-5-carboxylate reductase [Mariniphaga sp.]